ncbi:flagellar type III secretion system pore protein FliP [Methylobacterium sp. 092160098-2]|uniref:flagellar type III secretion system pore protein FliP n=1 Tax=Methylobacterium sp. 092160098-2 TaxID=3025129 RepID=UPI002381AA51|nr:flagellar type III secretion system pore protein FliP [Methylobacterium sp. 092160098-2]MDE4916009.1 flagellar type III secretion system pore protein FliP [Methylobacterium sp. 092160098-2]
MVLSRQQSRTPSGRPGVLGLAQTLVLTFLLTATPVDAQTLELDLGGVGASERALQLVALITLLSLAPSVLLVVTSFTRIVVVLSILRSAFGTPTAPPNAVITVLALFLTAFIMAPVGREAYRTGIEPLLAGEIEQGEAFARSLAPFRRFMLKNVREKELDFFLKLDKAPPPAKPDDIGLEVIAPAFLLSELRRAFEIGFLLFVPFLIIDLAAASVLMALGMQLMPPASVALPLKLIFFVLVDGWNLLVGSLLQSYG